MSYVNNKGTDQPAHPRSFCCSLLRWYNACSIPKNFKTLADVPHITMNRSEDTGDRWQRGGPLPDRDLDRRPPDRDLDRRPPERDLDRRPRSEDRVQDDRPPLDDRRPPPDDRFDRRPPDDRIRDDRGPPGGSWRDRERDRGSRDGPAFRYVFSDLLMALIDKRRA